MSIQMHRPNVLIVGARCAGASLATLLARSGLDVLVVDKTAYGSDTLSTHILMRTAVVQLARWGLLDRVRAAGTPPVRAATFHYGADAVRIDVRPRGEIDALYAPRRTVLDRILVDAARAAGAEVAFGARFEQLLRDGDRVTGALVRDRDGMHVITADYVIGADGIRSRVAADVGAPLLHRAEHTSATIYGYFAGLEDDGYHWHYEPGLNVGFVPTHGGHNVFAVVPPARLPRAATDIAGFFARACARGAPGTGLAEARQQGPLRRFPGIRGFLRQSVGAGWALVGDAAYFKDPITAHGISDALRDAELLARALIAGRASDLESYQRERDRLSLELFVVTDEIAGFGWDLDRVRVLHRRLNDAMRAEVEFLGALDAADARAA